MARFLRNNDDEALEGNVYYCKTTKLLPPVERKFKLHSSTWIYHAFVGEGILFLRFTNICTDIKYLSSLFKVRVGIVEIVGNDLKEIIAFNTIICTYIELIKKSELDSILQKNEFLYLFIEIRRKDEIEYGLKIKARKQQIEADFKELLLNGKNSDVTIEVKHKRFNCHRCILGARSPVFAAMFENDMKEKSSGVVTIEDADPAVFEEFLLYLYSGNEDLLSWKNVTDMYKLADKYFVEDMKMVCAHDITVNINEENFYEFLKLARLHNCSALTETVIQFFFKESKKIVRSKNWVRYLSEYPVECNILITALVDKSQNPIRFIK